MRKSDQLEEVITLSHSIDYVIEKRGGHMKKIILIFLLVFFVFGWFWTEGYGLVNKERIGATPEEALFNFCVNREIRFRVSEIIAIEKIDDSTMLLFYENKKNNYMVALIEKKWNNKWKFISTAGEAWTDENKDISPRYSYVGMELPLYWGFIDKEKIASVKVSDNYMEKSEATIVEINEIALFYIVAAEPRKGWDGAVLTAYDEYGEIVVNKTL